jgi:hypothetical protein
VISLFICRAKPNPEGKKENHLPHDQKLLLGEWVDLENHGDNPINLCGLWLAHQEFVGACAPKNTSTRYWHGLETDVLKPGEVLRVHTGKLLHRYLGRFEDFVGADRHVFAESDDFVLNTRHGDCLTLWSKGPTGRWTFEDACAYAPNPASGSTLVRRANRLIPESGYSAPCRVLLRSALPGVKPGATGMYRAERPYG